MYRRVNLGAPDLQFGDVPDVESQPHSMPDLHHFHDEHLSVRQVNVDLLPITPG